MLTDMAEEPGSDTAAPLLDDGWQQSAPAATAASTSPPVGKGRQGATLETGEEEGE